MKVRTFCNKKGAGGTSNMWPMPIRPWQGERVWEDPPFSIPFLVTLLYGCKDRLHSCYIK